MIKCMALLFIKGGRTDGRAMDLYIFQSNT